MRTQGDELTCRRRAYDTARRPSTGHNPPCPRHSLCHPFSSTDILCKLAYEYKFWGLIIRFSEARLAGRGLRFPLLRPSRLLLGWVLLQLHLLRLRLIIRPFSFLLLYSRRSSIRSFLAEGFARTNGNGLLYRAWFILSWAWLRLLATLNLLPVHNRPKLARQRSLPRGLGWLCSFHVMLEHVLFRSHAHVLCLLAAGQ